MSPYSSFKFFCFYSCQANYFFIIFIRFILEFLNDMSFSPYDDNLLATCSNDGNVCIYLYIVKSGNHYALSNHYALLKSFVKLTCTT